MFMFVIMMMMIRAHDGSLALARAHARSWMNMVVNVGLVDRWSGIGIEIGMWMCMYICGDCGQICLFMMVEFSLIEMKLTFMFNNGR
jgi:hypothetical protein